MRTFALKILAVATLQSMAFAVPCSAAAPAVSTETIVMIRHGEKPADDADIGQLTCQGQNRALALPNVLLTRYGTPDALFAQKPQKDESDNDGSYYSLRALATIEPTAIAAARTVKLGYRVYDIAGLQHELLKSKFDNATVFIAWEHKKLEDLAKNLVKAAGGDDSVVPKWHGDDFDSIYIVQIQRSGSSTSVSFKTDAEQLDNQPTSCAGAPAS
jgi:hypothetical protein